MKRRIQVVKVAVVNKVVVVYVVGGREVGRGGWGGRGHGFDHFFWKFLTSSLYTWEDTK